LHASLSLVSKIEIPVGGAVMTIRQSKSAAVRAKLNHPVIDSDGHVIEFEPAVLDQLREIGGPRLVERFRKERYSGMMSGLGNLWRWYELTPEERRDQRVAIPPWWGFPAKNTLDRATALLPRLLHERLDEVGVDVSVLYPSLGLNPPHLDDEELRRAVTRAYNKYYAEVFAGYTDRLIPVAVIPMHTPQEAIEELEYAVKTLGMKAAVFAGHVLRPVPCVARTAPEAARYAYWLDVFCIDSEYDYDPVWAKCIELKVPPTFHSVGYGWGSRVSISNFMYNHIGHFGSAGEALCKAMFFGGVTRRFPQLKCAFLESGVSWGASLYADLLARWKKRSPEGLENYNPANLNTELLVDLCRRYGSLAVTSRLAGVTDRMLTINVNEAPPEPNDFARTGIKKPEDIRDLFVPHFYFGCEADDPMNASAFSKANPYGARMRAVFSSDIGHWDVPDMTKVTEEAYELVEDGIITEEDFRDFVFTNPVTLWTGMNPEFFKGTLVEKQVDQLLASGVK
jgi:predicted TIM-barrel fold metal-dependent hydrolase